MIGWTWIPIARTQALRLGRHGLTSGRMKGLMRVLFLAALALPLAAQETKSEVKKISAGEAGEHFQDTWIVTGDIAQVTIRSP